MRHVVSSFICRLFVVLLLSVSVVSVSLVAKSAHAGIFTDAVDAVSGALSGGSDTTTTGSGDSGDSGDSGEESSGFGSFLSGISDAIGGVASTITDSFFAPAASSADGALSTTGGAVENFFTNGLDALSGAMSDPVAWTSVIMGAIGGVYDIPLDYDGDGDYDGGFIYDTDTDDFLMKVPDGDGGFLTVGSIDDALALGIDMGDLGSIMANGSGVVWDVGGLFTIEFGDFFSGAFGDQYCGQKSTKGLGQAICSGARQLGGLPSLLTIIAYVSATIMTLIGTLKFVEHVNDPRSVPIWEPIKRYLVGGALYALPFMMEITDNLLGNGIGGVSNTGMAGNISGGGLDAMLVKLMSDIWSPMLFAITSFCYIAGIILLMVGIHRLLKSAQDGPRGPAGFGTIMTFIVAGALLSIDAMMAAFSGSLFNMVAGGSQIHTYGVLAQSTGDTAVDNHIAATIGVGVAFMMIVGWISFIRGFFILRGVAEGDQQASLMAAVTHLLGGALAVNIGPVIEMVQSTLGLSTLGLDFGV